ncbi:hypothetical protein LPB87_17935 [Flavobacterium sp. EDS]|nr:hypothetical protein [Flavobacterium sp. EDS]
MSQDPIGLLSGEFGFYNYVEDSNAWLDIFGLVDRANKIGLITDAQSKR